MSFGLTGARLAALAATLLLAGCGEPEPLRIGFLAELTGRAADTAEAARNGALIAIDNARNSGVLKGRRVDVLVRDTGPDADSVRKAAEELVAARVDAIIGPTTSGMLEKIQAVTDQAGVVVISPTASGTQFHGKDDHVFRINWTTRDNGGHYGRYYHGKGLRRIAVAVNQNNKAFAENWLKEFRSVYEPLGGVIAATPYFDSNADNLEPVVEEMLAANPDSLLFIGNAVDVPRLAQIAHKRKPGLPMVTSEWAGTLQLIELGGKAVEGLMLVQNYDHDGRTPEFVAFRDAYQQRFGKPAAYSAVLAHDAATVLTQALAKRDKNMTTKAAILKANPYQGLQQEIRFDANGDTQRQAYFVVIRDGKFVRDR